MLQEAGGPRMARAGARGQGGRSAGRGAAAREPEEPFQPRAPRAAASSGFPGFPLRPAPPRSRVRRARWADSGAWKGARSTEAGRRRRREAGKRGDPPGCSSKSARSRLGPGGGLRAAAGPGRDAGLPGPRRAGRAAGGGRELSVVLKRRRRPRPGARSRGALLGVPPQPRGGGAVARPPMPDPRAPRRRRDRPRQDR